MPDYVVERVADALNSVRKPINGSRIHLIGVAYKRDVNDMRESPALDILELLEQARRDAQLLRSVRARAEARRSHADVRSTSRRRWPSAGLRRHLHRSLGVRLRGARRERHARRRHAQRAQGRGQARRARSGRSACRLAVSCASSRRRCSGAVVRCAPKSSERSAPFSCCWAPSGRRRCSKWPNVWWWRFARVLGHFNARVLLTVMFVVVFVPLGLIWRLTGKDPLARRRTARPGWSPYPSRYRDRRHYQRMY